MPTVIHRLEPNVNQVYEVHVNKHWVEPAVKEKSVSGVCLPKHFTDKPGRCWIDLKKNSHIKFNALREYDEFAQAQPGAAGPPVELYKDCKPMYYKIFSIEQSLLFESIYLTTGRKILTLVERKLDLAAKLESDGHGHDAFTKHYTPITQNLQKTVKARLKCSTRMKEWMPHHVGTHLPGMRTGGSHGHMSRSKAYSEQEIDELIDHLFHIGAIGKFPVLSNSDYKPRVIKTLGKEHRAKFIQQTKDELRVLARV